MKKSLLIVFIATAFSQVKAQQLFQLKPADSLTNDLTEKYFKVKPDSQQQLFQLRANPAETMAFVDTRVKVSSIDHMPVAFLQGDSKMPVAKFDGLDKMPVLKLGNGNTIIIDPKKITP